MNWDAIGAIAELLGAIGVITSLVYLASQIRQSSTVTRLTLQENYVSGIGDLFARIYSDPELLQLWYRGIRSPDELSEEDRDRIGMIQHGFFQRFALVWHARELDSPVGRQCLALIDLFAHSPATQSWWSRQRVFYDSAFAAYVDARIGRARGEQ